MMLQRSPQIQVISRFNLVHAIIALLVVMPQISIAGGCPPWKMCGKKGNQIIPDSGGYEGGVAAATSAVSSGASPYDVTQPLNVNRRSLELGQEISNAQDQAKAKAESVEFTTPEDSRRVGNSIWVLDRSGTGR